jgi:hypothetical protein
MGDVVSITEARRTGLRRQVRALDVRCRQLIADSIEAWRVASLLGPPSDRATCRQRVRALSELLAATRRVG